MEGNRVPTDMESMIFYGFDGGFIYPPPYNVANPPPRYRQSLQQDINLALPNTSIDKRKSSARRSDLAVETFRVSYSFSSYNL